MEVGGCVESRNGKQREVYTVQINRVNLQADTNTLHNDQPSSFLSKDSLYYVTLLFLGLVSRKS